jgi:hypothetical protein
MDRRATQFALSTHRIQQGGRIGDFDLNQGAGDGRSNVVFFFSLPAAPTF